MLGITVCCQYVNKLRPPGTTIELYHNSLLHSQQNWHMAVNKNTWNEYNHVSKYGIFRPYVLSLVNDIPWGILTKANGKMNVISNSSIICILKENKILAIAIFISLIKIFVFLVYCNNPIPFLFIKEKSHGSLCSVIQFLIKVCDASMTTGRIR